VRVPVAIALLVAGFACKEPGEQKAAEPPPRPAPRPRPPVAAPDAGPRPPAGITPEHLEAADAIEAWFKTVAAAARGNASDCNAMAAALTTVGAKGRPIVARAVAIQKGLGDPAAAAWFEDYTRDKMSTGFNDLVAAMGPCAEHAAIKRALKTIAR
jgi:hypothetical protein